MMTESKDLDRKINVELAKLKKHEIECFKSCYDLTEDEAKRMLLKALTDDKYENRVPVTLQDIADDIICSDDEF